jgi:hypothetical protein
MNKTTTEATQTEQTRPEAFNKAKPGLAVEMMDQWLAEHYQRPEDVLGREGLLAQLAKAVHVQIARGNVNVKKAELLAKFNLFTALMDGS